MKFFRRKPAEPLERRLPENAEKRQMIDQLKKVADAGEKMATQGRLEEARQKAKELDPRISRIEKMADVLYRRHAN